MLHSSEYRDLDQIRGKRVLVVGGGNSACDIVVDAGRGADRAVISMRRGYWFIPKHVFGVPSDVFADSGPKLPAWLQQRVFGVLLNLLYGKPEKLGLQKPDHKIFETHPVLNSNLFLSLQHGDVTAKPGISTTSGRTVTFVDGSTEDFDLIIYATGYLHTVPYARRYFPERSTPRSLSDDVLPRAPGSVRRWLSRDQQRRLPAFRCLRADDRQPSRRPGPATRSGPGIRRDDRHRPARSQWRHHVRQVAAAPWICRRPCPDALSRLGLRANELGPQGADPRRSTEQRGRTAAGARQVSR